MIFESKRAYASAGHGQSFAWMWNTIRNKLECSRMVNVDNVNLTAGRVVDLANSLVQRSVVRATNASPEQFGVCEQGIDINGRGIVRRNGIARVKMVTGMVPVPAVGDRVVVSDTEPGSGTVTALASPRVGTITDVTGFHAVNNPYVYVLLRRCTALGQRPPG
jgi:hypothetical protein